MKKRTRWKRVYHPMIGVMFHDDNKYLLKFFTIKKMWQCKEYINYGSQWTSRYMMKVKTHDGLTYKMPLYFWEENIMDDYGKTMFKYFYESPCIDRKEKFKQFLHNLKDSF